ncbi:acyltransferase [Pseudofrankia sp. BMG5.36]|uniref:acyltransferase family protein n=1 Tax=Pseudofrankia sp. BMG5.36 TaxID=1834512 RepID=UPI0008DB201E|nr:acyltransferase [Pseudofrankia sp. BMG5.36]
MGASPREPGEEPAGRDSAQGRIYTDVEYNRYSVVDNGLRDLDRTYSSSGAGSSSSFVDSGLEDLGDSGGSSEPWPRTSSSSSPPSWPEPAGHPRRRRAAAAGGTTRRRGWTGGRLDRRDTAAGRSGKGGQSDQGAPVREADRGGEARGGMRPGGYNPALDGLRAIAVLCVLGYHMAALGGGYLGVDVFLVLSGFLITGLLLAERDRTGGISLKAFYVRRAFRLMPAYYAFVVIGAVLVVLLKTRADQLDFLDNALTSLLYVNDYFRVLRPDSGGAWFGHVWSLSLEEQFYLLWPVALVAICRREALARRLPAILFGGAVVVAVWRATLADLGVSGNRTYFALDTRSDSLLIGCALAAWLRASRLEAREGEPHAGGAAGAGAGTSAGGRVLARILAALPVAGPLALAALAVAVLTVPENGARTTVMDRGGFTGVALLAAALILALDQGRPTWLFRVIGCRPLAWLGRISYGFYLWHFPVTGFAGDKLVARLGRGPATVVAGLLAIGLAAASYYLLEGPIQRRRPKWASGRSAPVQTAGTAGTGVPGVPVARPASVAMPVGETTVRLSRPVGPVPVFSETTMRLRLPRRGNDGQER